MPEMLTVPKRCVFDDGKVVLWHDQDKKFTVPKAHVQVKILSDHMDPACPKQSVLAYILTELLKQSLSEVTYYASLAEVDFDLSPRTFGLSINCFGYVFFFAQS